VNDAPPRARRGGPLRDSILLALGLAVPNLLQFAFFGVLGRHLTPEAYGAVAALTFAIAVCTAPAAVAASLLAARVAAFTLAGERASADRLAASWTGVALAVGAALTALCLVAADPIATFLRIADANAVRALGPAAAFGIAIFVQRGGFQGARRFGPYVVSNLVEAIVKFGLGWWIAFTSRSAAWALLAVAAAFGSALLYGVLAGGGVAAPRRGGSAPEARETPAEWPAAAALSVVGALSFADTIVAKHLLGAGAAALYGTIALLGRAESIGLSVFAVTVLPHAAQSGRRPLVRVLALSLGLTVCAALCGALAPAQLLGLVGGARYAVATPALGLYLLAIGLLATGSTALAHAVGRREVALVTAGAVALVVCAEAFAFVRGSADVLRFAEVLAAGHAVVAAVCIVEALRPARR
jgi:O-antigen/teichoic acid export membrane protein